MHWLNDNAGAIQAIASVILVFVTGFYAWRNHQLTQLTNKMADTANKAVEESRNQYRNSVMPTLTLDWPSGFAPNSLHGFAMVVNNIGTGPALDIGAKVINPSLHDAFQFIFPQIPLSLPAGEHTIIQMTFKKEQVYILDDIVLEIAIDYHDVYSRLRTSHISISPAPARDIAEGRKFRISGTTFTDPQFIPEAK